MARVFPTVLVDEPLQCSQGGIPFNKAHLDARDAEIDRLRAALDIARTGLLKIERRCEEARAEISLAREQSTGGKNG